MKLLFLDIDGVLNCAGTFATREQRILGRYFLDRAMIARLDRVIEATGADVVVSSCWRRGDDGRSVGSILSAAGLCNRAAIVGETPHLGATPRGREIAAYLAASQPFPDTIAIVDDDDDVGYLRPYLVQTDWARGLDDQVERELIEHLGRIGG